MKRLSLLTTIGIVLLVACNPHSKPAETATISGQVIPKTEDYLSFSAGTVLDSTKINADGHFETVIPVTGPVYGMLIYHNRMTQIYLQPGGHLVVHIQSRSFPDNTAFEGNLGPANHYLMLAGKLDRQVQIADKQLFSMPPDRFIAYSDSVRNLKSQLLKEYVKRYPEIDSSFVRAHQTDILYNWATQRILYPENYLILKGRTAKLPDSYHRNYLKQLDINQPANLASAAFQTFLNYFLDFQEALYLRDNPD
ncbi:MAG: hypothetical protein J7L89_09510, partial [Bacteroidales bacterium]|nr:hypothetical protein [Bacteroidales bacterium]